MFGSLEVKVFCAYQPQPGRPVEIPKPDGLRVSPEPLGSSGGGQLERRGHRFVRYADDSNIYVRSERAGQRVMESVTRFITEKLKLKVVAKPQERKFLGFSFTGYPEPKRRVAPKAVKRFKERVREITRRRKGNSMGKRVEELKRYLTGWRGYFGFCQTPSVLAELDSWVRRGLRCIFWIQWKTGRRRYDELHRRGAWNGSCRRIPLAATMDPAHERQQSTQCRALQCIL